jgi:hypothetical protein
MKESNPERVVLPIHFEDRGCTEFERLCFAYILGLKEWKSIDWYGQLGGDRGRDIWGITEDRYGRDENICFQCANHRSLRFNKAKEDIDKIISGPNILPDIFILITGGKVSANMKNKIKAYAKAKGIKIIEIWSGIEFEERLRKDSPSLIRRFVEGETFPETAEALKLFVIDKAAISDDEILSLMAQCFDRPAFTTPFHMESSIPAFKKAITDTIEVLNTGIHRLRDGTVIRKIPSRHDIHDNEIPKILSIIVRKLSDLRCKYDEFIKTGDIKPCACNDPDCPVFMLSQKACHVMDEVRYEILGLFRSIHPKLFINSRYIYHH